MHISPNTCIFAHMKRVLMLLNNYDTDTHKGVAIAAKELGWYLNAGISAAFNLPKTWKGDGIICALGDSKELADFVMKAKVPTVDLSYIRTDLDFPRVIGNHSQIGQLAARHFCAFGHTNFAWFSTINNPTSKMRLEEFQKELDKTKADQCI
jgi:DNA-binding LacI/PurR family transcriptional regulator